ncbi:MAG: polysaccharide biosynthesis/export family protein, partial [Planctomycetes bacterium]|nr:polysaccharide biosynthesis/export family protein [Planctomycetota bacterium]
MKQFASLILLMLLTGCWAPLRVEGIPARQLPDHYRLPLRTLSVPLNYSQLTAPTNNGERLGTGDKLNVTIPGLFANPRLALPTIQVQVTSTGEVFLPLVGSVNIGGLNLAEAQKKFNQAYVP